MPQKEIYTRYINTLQEYRLCYFLLFFVFFKFIACCKVTSHFAGICYRKAKYFPSLAYERSSFLAVNQITKFHLSVRANLSLVAFMVVVECL